MDSNTDEKRSETENYIFILPDVLLVRILSELSWKDILNVRAVSRSFYNFIYENYYQLNRREVYQVRIFYAKDFESCPFELDLKFDSIRNYKSTNSNSWVKSIGIQSDEKLSSLLKIFDMRNLEYLSMEVDCNIDIFGIINRSFQEGTKIEDLIIYGLSEKNLTSFKTFIDKLLLVEDFSILNICYHSTESKDVNPLSFIQSLNITRSFLLYECNETRILSTDMVNNFLRRNPSVERFTIGSGNSEFMRNLFKEHFMLEQPHTIDNNLSCKKLRIRLEFYVSEYKQLSNILENDLYERENVQEVISIQNFPEYSKIESVIYCRHCPKDKHKIEIDATLEGVYLNTCDRL
uniref:F-box domain-containing protein n=1 Tax=Strongyloides papillosus TaxID=174720 RepID=A0A0N5CCV9_STREA